MFNFYNLTPVNGLDKENLLNARQNNYAWSMTELGEYIYVGTGRNVAVLALESVLPGLKLPISVEPLDPNFTAEIWRYKKGSEENWERVFVGANQRDFGFRFMTTYRPFDGNPAIYASTAVLYGHLYVYKSVNGVDWKKTKFELENGGEIQGTSSRGMVSHNGKLYLTAVTDGNKNRIPLLYSSKDPEFYPWKLETPLGTNTNKNPQGTINNIAVFNNRIYVATATDTGVQIWRTNTSEPKIDDWTLVVDKGFGNPDNMMSIAIGVFKNHLYVSATKELPLSWAIPRGCDIVRIDKYDNWEIVVGPNSISGIWSGFFNPFNVYAWQMVEYNGKLVVATFDDAINMQTILEVLLLNKEILSKPPLSIPKFIIDILIEVYKLVVELLNTLDYPFGFDMYVSKDGKHFEPIFLNGLDNRYNYGARMLYVDSCNDLYIGTANPYQGLEVWSAEEEECYLDAKSKYIDKQYDYKMIKEKIESHFVQLEEYMPQIKEILPQLIERYFPNH